MSEILNRQIFTMPRKGLLGDRPIGADYMLEINKRAKRLQKAVVAQKEERDIRQLDLFGDEE